MLSGNYNVFDVHSGTPSPAPIVQMVSRPGVRRTAGRRSFYDERDAGRVRSGIL